MSTHCFVLGSEAGSSRFPLSPALFGLPPRHAIDRLQVQVPPDEEDGTVFETDSDEEFKTRMGEHMIELSFL